MRQPRPKIVFLRAGERIGSQEIPWTAWYLVAGDTAVGPYPSPWQAEEAMWELTLRPSRRIGPSPLQLQSTER